jgi:hypothetical protein
MLSETFAFLLLLKALADFSSGKIADKEPDKPALCHY